MAVKVLIKRRFKEGKAKEVFALLNKFRAEAMLQTGYITGVAGAHFQDGIFDTQQAFGIARTSVEIKIGRPCCQFASSLGGGQ